MRTLYHLPLDPGCRQIRILLGEKRLEVALKTEKIWERREGFLKLNPAGEVPVLPGNCAGYRRRFRPFLAIYGRDNGGPGRF